MIGLGSTMVGQLSAGASFDEAFQAGMKAGVVSAVAAGAAYGVNDYLGLNPTGVDATGKLMYSEAAMRYYRLSAVERLGTGTFWAQASSNAVTRGVLAQAQGGKFATGMVGGFTGTMLSSTAQIIGDVTGEGFSLENVLLHTGLGCVGALAAGDKCAAGAIGGGVSAAVSPWVGKAFSESGPRTPVEKMITAVTSVTAGMGVAAALGYDHLPAGQAAQNEVMNNYLDHRRPQMLRLSEKERYENAVQGCANGNQAACRVRDELAALSRARDIRLRNACNGSNPALCNELAREATEMGNVVYGRQGELVYANSPKSGPIRLLNTETISAPSRPRNFHDKLARSTFDATLMEGGNIVAGAALGWTGKWFSKLQGWGATKEINFANESSLINHFEKHGSEFGAYNTDAYLQTGREIIRNGYKVKYLYRGEYRTGYVKFIGNSSNGNAKFGFVGTNADGVITTIHTQSGNSFWKLLNGSPTEKIIRPTP